MTERKIRWISKLAGWLAAAVVLALFWGGDIKSFVNDRVVRNQLRAEACTLMTNQAFLTTDAQEQCETDNTVYLEGITSAVSSETARLQAKVATEEAIIQSVTNDIDLRTFSPIALDDILAAWDPLAFILQDQDVGPPVRHALTAEWLMITGYGQIRVERPNSKGDPADAAVFDLAPSLSNLKGSMLQQICSRGLSQAHRCTGTLYYTNKPGTLSPFTVVGLELTPITSTQINITSMNMLAPDFEKASVRLEGFYYKRFLQMFVPNPEQ